MQELNLLLKIVTIFLYSAAGTYMAMPYVIEKLRKYKYTWKDMHKLGHPLVPAMGGIAMFAGVMVSLALSQLLMRNGDTGNLFIFYFVITAYALYGLLDDIFHFRRRYDKIAVLLVMSLPISSLLDRSGLNVFGYFLELNGLYLYLLVPIYIMVVANLINIHAGFNGLGPGTATLVMIAAGLKSFMVHGWTYMIYLMPILGASIVFMFYNWQPAKVFDGNIGAFLMGGGLGAFLIVNGFEIFGAICLIPNIITFMLDTWYLAIRKVPDVEFPKIRKDRLIVPHKSVRYKSFKFLLCSVFPLTERKATIINLGITALCCAAAVVLT